MRKLLIGFLMTLRWLLVPLLPVLGLLAGLWLKPDPKARWEVNLGYEGHCAGLVALDNSRCLALYRQQDLSNRQTVHEIVGIDLDTGLTRFTERLPDPGPMVHIQLLPGTTLAMYFNRLDPSVPFRLYDWQQKQVVFRGLVREYYYKMRSVSYHNHVLAADLGGHREGILAFWNDQESDLPAERLLHLHDCMDYDLQLSQNGRWAVIRYAFISEAGTLKQHVQLLDTLKAKVVQELSIDIKSIRWHSHDEGFLALQFDSKTRSHFLQYYRRQGEQFMALGKANPTVTGTVLKQSPSPFLVIATTNSNDDIRSKVSHWLEFLGPLREDVMHRLWPVSTTFNLFSIDDGQLAHRIMAPEVKYEELGSYLVHPDVLGEGLVLQQRDKLTNMDFYPASRWYPRLGLTLGIVLAILLAWLNLRPIREVKPTHA